MKRLAASGGLTWNGKKVVLDPFTEVDYDFEVTQEGSSFNIICKSGGEIVTEEMVFPLGLLRHQIFRFWKDGKPETVPAQLTLLELKKLVDDELPLKWKCEVPKWKIEPVPFLVLKDRTGAFAELWMDYGPTGKAIYQGFPEEISWEKDLLETDFIRKAPGYYCPMDKVVKSLTFLLDIGWTIFDFQGKKVVRQGAAEWETKTEQDHLLVTGRVNYGMHTADAKNVLGAFNRRDRFLSLSPWEVGLIDCPTAWETLAQEPIVTEGIRVKRSHVGLLEGIVPLPPEYRSAEWETTKPGASFQGTLFNYQQQGVDWLSYLYRSGFSGLLADEMGLGKTVQVIAFLSTLQFQKPILIVMPVSLLFHWRKELERFLPGEAIAKLLCLEKSMILGPVASGSGAAPVHSTKPTPSGLDEENACDWPQKGDFTGRMSFAIASGPQVMLTSYAQLRQNRMYYESMDYEVVILDEAQAIKNPDTLTAQIVCRLRASFRLAMTGTPVENRYDDLWSLFRFLMPDLLGDRKESPVFERVRKKIRPFTLRRTKQEVDLQLPEKEEQLVWVSLEEDERNFYDNYLREKRSSIVEKVTSQGISSQNMEILELILRLRQICCHPQLITGEYGGASSKFERVCDDLLEVVQSGHKVILYSQFTSMLKLFRKWLDEQGLKYAYLDGQTKDREKSVEAFQTEPEVQIFLISLKAGGVGLNLQAADYVFLYDPWWNTAVEKQAIDRAHRVGRKGRVIARKYLMAETIEEKILKLQHHKSELSDQLLEFEGEMMPISLEELYQLL